MFTLTEISCFCRFAFTKVVIVTIVMNMTKRTTSQTEYAVLTTFIIVQLIISDINECASQPCNHGGRCANLLGSFTCNCAKGYKGPTCALDAVQIEDVKAGQGNFTALQP